MSWELLCYRPPQRLRFLQRFRAPNAALLFRAAHEYVARVLNVEEVETKLVLGEDTVEKVGVSVIARATGKD